MSNYITGLGMTSKRIKEYFHTDTLYVCGQSSEFCLLFTEEGFENIVSYLDFSVPELRPMCRFVFSNSRVCNLKRDDDFWVFLQMKTESIDGSNIYLWGSKRKGCYYCSAKVPNNELSLDYSKIHIDKARKLEVKFGEQDLDLSEFDVDDDTSEDNEPKKFKPFLGSYIVPITIEE